MADDNLLHDTDPVPSENTDTDPVPSDNADTDRCPTPPEELSSEDDEEPVPSTSYTEQIDVDSFKKGLD